MARGLMTPFLLCGPLATVPVARVPVCQPAMGLAGVPTSVCSEEGCVCGDNAKHDSGSFPPLSHLHTLTVQPRPAGYPSHGRGQGAGSHFVGRKHSFL